MHLGRLVENDRQRYIDRVRDGICARRIRGLGITGKVRVFDEEVAFFGCLSDDRKGTTLAFAEILEVADPLGGDRHDVAFLGFVAPDFEGRHAGFIVRNGAQVDATAAVALVEDFRNRIGQPAGAHVVDRQDRTRVTQRRAAIDDLLTTAFDLGIAALDRSEIEVLVAGPRGHRRGRAASEADQHGRPAEYDDLGAGRGHELVDVHRSDIAEATRKHDGLVIAAHLGPLGPLDFLAVGPEIARQVWSPELVVEGGAADRSFEHDVEGRGDSTRLARIDLPGSLRVGQEQVRNGEAGQTRLGFASTAGRPFIANLTARPSRRPREG